MASTGPDPERTPANSPPAKSPHDPKAVARVDLRRSNRARRVLWIGSVAVLVPLMLLLWLQYRWLQDLERTSTIARQSALENYLGVIAKEVKFHYISAAERVLNLSSNSLDPKFRGKMGKYFKKRSGPTAKRLFLIDFDSDSSSEVLYYDAEVPELYEPEWNEDTSAELGAVHMAIATWRVLYKKGDPVDDSTYIVEERDRQHRMVLKPITGEDSKLAGMVGMILDEEYFRAVALPQAIANALPEFGEREKLQVSVRDAEAQWAYGEQPWVGAEEPENLPLHRHLTFVFRDWEVFLTGPNSTPEDWARTNFAFNLSLTVVLSIVLIGGLGLLLRVTSREMHLSEMKNDFVSNVSHELRTPLASIRVFGELLRLGKIHDQAKVEQYGGHIEAESRRLTQLINNILDFSSIESGRKAYAFEPVDAIEVAHEVLDTWRVRLEHQGFVIDFREPKTLPAVRADRNALGQAFFNLLDNAVKYSGDSKRIVVRLSHTANEVVFEVTDYGIGISRAEQEHIFDRFHRVGSGLAHDVKGSGLGLSLVSHIAAAHGGRIHVESTLGEGSTFTLYFPLAEGDGDTSLQPSPVEAVRRA